MVLLRILPSAFDGLMALPDRGRSLTSAAKLLKNSCAAGEIPPCTVMCPITNLIFSVVPQIGGSQIIPSLYTSTATIVGGNAFGSVRIFKKKPYLYLEIFDAGYYSDPAPIPIRKAA
jgi:hypothetical protein